MRNTSDLTPLQRCLQVKEKYKLADLIDIDQLVNVSDLICEEIIEVKQEEINVLKRLVKILENN